MIIFLLFMAIIFASVLIGMWIERRESKRELRRDIRA